MRKHNHEYSRAVLHVCFTNVCIIALFSLLAAVFHHWWIVLISLLFQNTLPHPIASIDLDPDSQFLTCSFCGEILLVDNLEHSVHREMKDSDWVRLPCVHGWVNVCPYCTDRYKEVLEHLTSANSSEGV